MSMNAYGTILERGDGEETETFTAIAHITNISAPSIEREALETTAHRAPGSPGAGWREFIGGLKDGGEVSADINFNPADHAKLLEDFEDSAPRNYRIVLPDPDSTTWEFSAVMTGFESEFPYDGLAEGTVTLKVSGKPTLSSGGGS